MRADSLRIEKECDWGSQECQDDGMENKHRECSSVENLSLVTDVEHNQFYQSDVFKKNQKQNEL